MTNFSLGSVLGRTFSMIGRSFASVGLLIIAAQVLMGAIQFGISMPALVRATTDPAHPFALFQSSAYWGSLVAGLAVFSVLSAGATYGFIEAGAGRTTSIGDCLRVGLAKALPVLGLSLLWMLGIWVGMIFLIVPGLILMTMWSVAVPALIGDDTGVIGSFGRSRELTKGFRLKIFALLLLLLVVYYVLALVVLGGAIMPTPGTAPSAAIAERMAPAMMAGSMIVTTVFLFLMPALLVAIYQEALSAKLGADNNRMSEVFA